MGLFGSIWKGVKKVGKGIGKVAKVAAPILAATGVGIPAAMAIGAGGSLLSGGGVKGALKSGLITGGAGLAGKALGTTGLLGKAKNLILGRGKAGTGIQPSVIDEAGNVFKAGGGSGVADVAASGGGGLLNRIKGFITENPARAASLGLGVGNLISGARSEGQGNRLLDAARARLQEPEREDLSGLFGGTGNPYATAPMGRSRRAALLALRGG